MKKLLGAMLVLGLVATTVQATDLTVSVQTAGGDSTVDVAAGGTVDYRVTGILSDDLNEGLALVGFNLVFDGGDLVQADTPVGGATCLNPMPSFVKPDGITNPAGFGGTVIGGDLIQVGGGQNTIKNTADNADFPIGTVLTGVAQPAGCGMAVIATGSLTVPGGLADGTYHLMLQDLFANVIRESETGEPFWATEAAGVGAIANLTINVVPEDGCIITSTFPPNCAIDAGYDLDPAAPATLFGWNSVDITVTDCSAQGITAADFTVSTDPVLPAPTITSVTDDGADTATLHLSGPISPGGWTCFAHSAGGEVCLGYLPGDVGGDGASTAADVLELLDDLNGVRLPPLEQWQCDADRSGICNPADVLGVIDLLNGAGPLEPWNNVFIPVCPNP